jgi:hypothetical protein
MAILGPSVMFLKVMEDLAIIGGHIAYFGIKTPQAALTTSSYSGLEWSISANFNHALRSCTIWSNRSRFKRVKWYPRIRERLHWL